MTWKTTGADPEALYNGTEFPSLDLKFADNKTLVDEVSGSTLVSHQRSMSGSNGAGTFVNSSGLVEESKFNLLTYSEQFNTGWQKFAGITVTPDTVVSPNGTITADTVSSAISNEYIYQTGVGSAGVSYTFSVWLRADTARNFGWIFYDNVSGVQSGNFAVTTEWQRFQITRTFGVGATDRRVGLAWQTPTTVYAWGAQLETGSTATTYIPTTNLPSAAPRFDHDPVTGESLGLLVEESRTNLLQYSNTLNGGSWVNTSGSPVAVATNSGIAPDGTFSASKLIEGNTTDIQRWIFNSYFSPATGWAGTFFAKAAERDNISLHLGFGGASIQARFNLSTQTATYTGNGNYAAQTTQKITALPNGWYKCELTTTGNIGGNSVSYSLYITDSSGNVSYTGDGVSGIYVWGAQLEQASFPTSYIPTSGSTVTRAADVAEITGSNFSSWYNSSEGTVFANCSFLSFTASPAVWSLKDNLTNSNHYIAVFAKTSGQIRYGSNDAGISQWSKDMVGAVALNTPVKTASAYKINDIAFSVDGASTLTDATATITTALDRLHLGYVFTGAQQLSGTISRLTYYPYRLSDARLQTITG